MSSFYPSYNASAQWLCQRCGRSLPPNEAYCGNCGNYNTLPPAQASNNAPAQPPSAPPWGNANAPAQPSAGTYQFGGGGPPWVSFPGQAPQNGAFVAPPMPQQGSALGGNSAAGQGPQSSPGGFYTAAAQQQAYPISQPGSMNGYQANSISQPFAPGYQPQGFTQPPEQKSRPHVGRIILLVLLLLVVVGGLAGGGYYLVKRNTNAVSTPSTTVNIAPTAVPKGKPIFQDAFSDNKNGWDTTSLAGVFSANVGNGSLVLEDDNSRLLWELVPGGRNFGNFFLTVDALLSKGAQNNGYGIYIRGASHQNVDIATYYRFEVYGDGSFVVFMGTVDASGASKSSPITSAAFSPAIYKQGQVNHIAISANGPSMSFLVNGQLLKTFSDTTYSAGSIALFVSNLTPPGAQATFSNLVVYPPQS